LIEDEMVPKTPVIPSCDVSNRKSSCDESQALVLYQPETQTIPEEPDSAELIAQKKGKMT